MNTWIPDIPETAPLAFSPRSARLLRDSGLDVVVTGGGGWIGLAVIEMLKGALGEGFNDRVHVFGASRRMLRLRSGASIESRTLGELRDLRIGPHVVAHLAFITREHLSGRGHDDYVAANGDISRAVLDHVERSDIAGLLLPSSGAVYHRDGTLNPDVRSNPYGALKLRDERRFAEVGVAPERLALIRIFNLAGPFLNKPEHYALGSILTDLRSGGPIELRADHPVLRSYMHVRDVADLAFAVMLGLVPGPAVPFDTAGEQVIEVGQLAELCATVLGYPEIRIERPPLRQGMEADRYLGDGRIISQLAEAVGLVPADLNAQITDTAAYMWTA